MKNILTKIEKRRKFFKLGYKDNFHQKNLFYFYFFCLKLKTKKIKKDLLPLNIPSFKSFCLVSCE